MSGPADLSALLTSAADKIEELGKSVHELAYHGGAHETCCLNRSRVLVVELRSTAAVAARVWEAVSKGE